MDINYNQEEIKFQKKVRQFLEAKLPDPLSNKVKNGDELTKGDVEQWHAILNTQGWLVSHWPTQYGGTNWSPIEHHIFDEECCYASAPRILPFGISMLAPVLFAFGNDSQKQFFLPKILSGEHWWCQGFSEPGAGSDLASLKTKAVLKDGYYIVNGQKTWTTLGQHANWIFCLVRTSNEGKPQTGISFLLIDLNTPGIEMRPIQLIDGSVEVNEVFFQDVKVPAENLVGEENKGWNYAKYLLTYERTGIAGIGASQQALKQLKKLTQSIRIENSALSQDNNFTRKIAELEIKLDALKTINLKVLQSVKGGSAPGLESSMLKIKGTEIHQAINHLTLQALGPFAAYSRSSLDAASQSTAAGAIAENADFIRSGAKASFKYFNNRKLSIFGGSNEIQKSIIAKQMLNF